MPDILQVPSETPRLRYDFLPQVYRIVIYLKGGYESVSSLLETDSYSQNTSSTCQSAPAYQTAVPSRSGPSALSLGGQSQASWHGGPALGEA